MYYVCALILAASMLLTGCRSEQRADHPWSGIRILSLNQTDCEVQDRDLMQTLNDLTSEPGQGFLGTVVPTKYRIYQTYTYDAKNDGWTGGGYVEIICRIEDMSAEHNSTAFHRGDEITITEEAVISLGEKNEEKERAFQEKIGVFRDPVTKRLPELTAEESERVTRGERVVRKYEIPSELLDSAEHPFDLYVERDIPTIHVAYDALIYQCRATSFVGFEHYSLYKAAAQDGTRSSLDTFGDFSKLLADHRASLGLAPIEAAK